MPRRIVSLGSGRPLLDIVSHARGGLGRRDRMSPAQVEHISLTVRRTPEVMIKVLSQGGQSLRAVQAHLEYIRTGKDRDLEDDCGERVTEKAATKRLLDDWDLDLEAGRRRIELAAGGGRKPPKLVHKLVLSMPAGTPPDKLLAAVRNFAREEFALQHRYALALHTDEPHPHVHLVVKAMSEQGVRLNIRKATLREWRQEFARHLRAQGVEANATERAVRGETQTHKLDGIYRAAQRGDSNHMRERANRLTAELAKGSLPVEPGKRTLIATRQEVERGWRGVSEVLVREGQTELARAVDRFVAQMGAPHTEKEALAAELIARARAERRSDVPMR